MNGNLGKALNTLLFVFAAIGITQIFIHSISKEESENEHVEKIKESYSIFSLSPPESFEFAGQRVPLSDPEVSERFDRELHSNTYYHSNTILYFKRANRWFPIIEPILEEKGIPNDFKYLALIESGLQNVVSPAGAAGYWQFMEKTALEYGLEVNQQVDERYHIEKSTRAACDYLLDAYKRYNDWSLVAASYNVGMNRIDKELERQKTNNYYDLLLNPETARYMFRIMSVKQIFLHPENYGFHIRKTDLYPPLEFVEIEVDSTINDLAQFSKEQDISYKILKYFNPWMRQVYLKNEGGKVYSLKIPVSTDYKLN